MYTEVRIFYECKVYQSGYTLAVTETVYSEMYGLSKKEISKQVENRKLRRVGVGSIPLKTIPDDIQHLQICPITKNANIVTVTFDEPIFEEFYALLDYPQGSQEQIVRVVDFYNRYGPVFGEHTDIMKNILNYLEFIKICDTQRADGERVRVDKAYLPELEFDIWEEGKVLPTYKPKNLMSALYAAWIFKWKNVPKRECKFHKDFGVRKGCEVFFIPKTDRAEFCSNDGKCRAAWHQKKKEK